MKLLHPYHFVFELPLYTPILISKDAVYADDVKFDDPDYSKKFLELVNFTGRIEAFNPTINQNSTYEVSHSPRNSFAGDINKYSFSNRIMNMEFKCVRNGHKITVVFVLWQKHFDENDIEVVTYTLEKIGQTPSLADLHIGQIRDYGTIISKNKVKELTKAIGLAAHGVGIGSFVYLRRIFESLIEQAHEEAKLSSTWDETLYSGRTDERIELLKEFLPPFLVENKKIYSILSKGIHELEETECLKYFPSLKVGIELILDEKLEKAQKQKRLSEAKKSLGDIIKEI